MHVQQARDLVTRLFEVIDGRDFDRLGAVFTPDAVYHRPGYEPLEGLEALTHFYTHERVITDGGHQVEQVTAGEEDVAACWGRFVGTGRDGSPLDEQFADTYLVADGRIAVRKTFFYRAAI